MPFLNGDKRAAACVTDFSAGDEFGFDSRTIIGRFHNPRLQCDRTIDWGGTQ